jgi:hypothetical protein
VTHRRSPSVTWMYEHLPKFCFYCGIICHGKTGCKQKSSLRHQEPLQYGSLLRATSPTQRVEKNCNRTDQLNGHVKESRAEKRSRPVSMNRSDGVAEMTMDEAVVPVTTGKPNSQNSNYMNSGKNNGVTCGIVFGKNPFIKDDARRGMECKPTGDLQGKSNVCYKKENCLKTAGKGKSTYEVKKDMRNGSSGFRPKTMEKWQDLDNLSPLGSSLSPNNLNRYSGPLFSEVEKTLHEEQLGERIGVSER